VQNSPDFSLIIGAASFLPITAIAAVVLTVKKKHNGKKNRESKTNQTKVGVHQMDSLEVDC
jgi:hypothetical protein